MENRNLCRGFGGKRIRKHDEVHGGSDLYSFWHIGTADGEIERAHRVFPRPNPEDRPRPILVRFMRSGDGDAILRAAREKGEIQYLT
ncbi:hypothetical protein QQF64_001080 [Cirrhinus molitorella]|uniref:Uncharacterized protein n=1 Tax=Cirrhinus molitorella TaxID=172907 RepID=A0ABR3NZK2_9TELE